jgi:hypothetical protein
MKCNETVGKWCINKHGASKIIDMLETYQEEDAEASRQLSVDLLEEERDLAAQRSTIYQQNLRRYHSRRVRKAHSKKGTWCYASNNRSPTSYPRLGKDPSSSAKLY